MESNSSQNQTVSDVYEFQICKEGMLWAYVITFTCFAILCLICQIVFAILVWQDRSKETSVQQTIFVTFHLIFLTSYSMQYLLQQSGQCGWVTIDNVPCKVLAWMKNFSCTTCNCLLLFPWNRQYSYIRHKLFSFRVYICCAICIFGLVNAPYIVFSGERIVLSGNYVKMSYCELNTNYDIVIEIIEVICGTSLLSSLFLVRVIKESIQLLRKRETKQSDDKGQEHRRYSQPPTPDVMALAKEKLNSRRLLLLNLVTSFSYIVLVLPQRYLDFILFLYGDAQTIHTIGAKNVSLMTDFNWRIMMSIFIFSPVVHGMCMLLGYILSKFHTISLFRRRTSQPLKRKIPIRQHTGTNFCRSLESVSENVSQENSEVDNGSIADTTMP